MKPDYGSLFEAYIATETDENKLWDIPSLHSALESHENIWVRHDNNRCKDWCATVIHIGKEHFIVMYLCNDIENHGEIIVEFAIKDGYIKCERVRNKWDYSKHPRAPPEASFDDSSFGEDYSPNFKTALPFEFALEGIDVHDCLPIDYSYRSNKTWTDPDRLFKWFMDGLERKQQ